jgi:uncharacterized Fe-S cluster-containing radical SAM superfamily enzyme
MSQLEKIAEIVAQICDEFIEINADGKVTIADFTSVVQILKEVSDLVEIDRLAVLSELDNLSHEKIDSIVAMFMNASDIDEAKKAVVIDIIRAVLDLTFAIDTIYDQAVKLKG